MFHFNQIGGGSKNMKHFINFFKLGSVAVLIALVAAGCDLSVDEPQHADSPNDNGELLTLIESLDPKGLMQLSRQSDALLPSAQHGDRGTLSNGTHWRNISDGEAFGLGISGLRPLRIDKAAAVTIDCQVETDANQFKKAAFANCVADLINICDGTDVYNDDETGYTNTEGYNRVYDDDGDESHVTCDFPDED